MQPERKASQLENAITIAILLVLCGVYGYLLLSPSQPHVLPRPKNFVLQLDTQEHFDTFLKSYTARNSYSGGWGWEGEWNSSSSSSSGGKGDYYHNWGKSGRTDDFLIDGYGQGGSSSSSSSSSHEPNVPSSKYRCRASWLSIRSELNYKYLWMHTGETMWMGATATMDTPLHRKAFEVVPVSEDCSDGGWVRIREGDSKGFLYMVPPTKTAELDEWVVKIGEESLTVTANDTQYHFLLEEEGYLLNRGSMAFVNVMPQAEYSVRGHSGGWDRTVPAGREYGAMMHFQFINESLVMDAIAKEEREQKEALEEDKTYIQQIDTFPSSKEKRVISFGLYGAKEKYTHGAIHNAELAKTYFPGWVCRFYVTSDVPADIVSKLSELGAEIEKIPTGMGYSSGMFWRFMVASDSSVDRYIVRDVDSRLNARDRLAVEDWIESKYPLHILRDHVNHCIVMNGGMWGGVKSVLPFMKDRIKEWSSRDEYMADLHFLEQKIWPDIKHKQLAHDSYCCDRFPNARPFPSKRPPTYQHVGQVFDAHDNPRLMDIDGFIRGVPVPGSCRKNPDWIYG